MVEDLGITGSRAIDQPWNSFKSDSYIDDLDWKLFVFSLIIIFILHEHHITKFKSMNKIFDRRTHISSAGPNIFDKGNLFRINLQFFSKPSVIEFNTLFLKENKVIRFVENMNT